MMPKDIERCDADELDSYRRSLRQDGQVLIDR